MSKLVKWSLASAATIVLVGSNLVSRAEPSQSEPSTQPTTRPDRRERGWDMRDVLEARQQRGGGFMTGRGGDYRNEEIPTEEEWDEIVEFMRQNSPVRLELYDKLAGSVNRGRGEGLAERFVQGARRRIAGRYRDLMAMKDRHPDMYEFAFKQIVLEDQILGYMRDLRETPENEALREKLRGKVADYVDNFLDEREARLKRLKEMVERETQTIQKDRASLDDLIDKQSEKFEREMARLLDFWEDPGAAMQQRKQ